jgi:hypothetical protein
LFQIQTERICTPSFIEIIDRFASAATESGLERATALSKSQRAFR